MAGRSGAGKAHPPHSEPKGGLHNSGGGILAAKQCKAGRQGLSTPTLMAVASLESVDDAQHLSRSLGSQLP